MRFVLCLRLQPKSARSYIESMPLMTLLVYFNIPTNLLSQYFTRLKNILNSSNYSQLVNFPTHELGNTLDLIMHPIDSNLVHSIRAGPLFSDHFSLLFQISVNKPNRPTISRSTRHLNHISISQFLTDLNMLPTYDAQSLHNSLIHTLTSMLLYLIKLLYYDLIHYGILLTFIVKNDVYACLNLNGKMKNLHHH